jgi:thymidylate synthase (FAD)
MVDKNFVQYADIQVDFIDKLGSDMTVVDAARVSFDKKSEWEVCGDDYGKPGIPEDPNRPWEIVDIQEYNDPYYRRLNEKDAKLIGYLAAHNHWSPFGHAQAQFRIKAPIFLARQLVKHQVGLVWNEVSRRYVDTPPEFYFPETWRGRPVGSMKQGSNEDVEIKEISYYYIDDYDQSIIVDEKKDLNILVRRTIQLSLTLYNNMVDTGVAPEQARMVLPQNMMVEWYWTGSLYAWARIYNLRSKITAQKEARDFAALLDAEINHLFPVSWKALTNYQQQ